MIRAAALGLLHREIAARAEVAHGTIRAIITRTDTASDTTTPPVDPVATNGGAPHTPPPA